MRSDGERIVGLREEYRFGHSGRSLSFSAVGTGITRSRVAEWRDARQRATDAGPKEPLAGSVRTLLDTPHWEITRHCQHPNGRKEKLTLERWEGRLKWVFWGNDYSIFSQKIETWTTPFAG